MKIVNVTCAIIRNHNKTLAVQRSEKMSHPLKWEFPGGKIEPFENEETCLKREIKEELDLEIDLILRLTPSTHHYPHISIRLIPYLATTTKGNLKLIEHKAYAWLTKNELKKLDWADADIPILEEYLNL